MSNSSSDLERGRQGADRDRTRAGQPAQSLGQRALARGLRDKPGLLRKLVIGEAIGEPMSKRER